MLTVHACPVIQVFVAVQILVFLMSLIFSFEELFGDTPEMTAIVERSSGVFGGTGIDSILYSELGGVELQLSGAEVVGLV